MKRTSTESLQIELVTKYDTNDAKKERLVEGVQICERGEGEGGVHIRGGSKSAVTPAQNVCDF